MDCADNEGLERAVSRQRKRVREYSYCLGISSARIVHLVEREQPLLAHLQRLPVELTANSGHWPFQPYKVR
ncbi:MAG: hypothetical protein ACI9JN_000976 [Bacteroidia bacterium]|jgi:hypothetical protein